MTAAAEPRGPRVGVAIVSWNVRDLLRRCLDSLGGGGAALRIVVVDNASADDTAAMVRTAFPAVTLIANPTNIGFTRGTNQALRALGVGGPGAPGATVLPYVLMLNPDTEVRPGALGRLADHLAAHPRVGAVGPLLRNPDGTVQSSRRRFPTVLTGLCESTPLAWHWPDNPVARRFRMADVPPTAGPVPWVTGAAILCRSAALAEVGLLDEGFFMYSEEVDLCRRLQAAGWAVHFLPSAEVVHHEGRSSEQVVPRRHREFQRSRRRYFRKHHGRWAAAVVGAGVVVGYGVELVLEAGKWLAGHKRSLRRDRVRAYWSVLRDTIRAPLGDLLA